MSSLSINNVILSMRRFCMHARIFSYRDNPMTTLHFTPRVQRRANLAFSGVPPKCRGAAAHQPGKNPLGTDIQSDGNEQTGNPALWPTQSTCPPVWLPEASTACGRPLPLLRVAAGTLVLRRGVWHAAALASTADLGWHGPTHGDHAERSCGLRHRAYRGPLHPLIAQPGKCR